MSFSVMESPSLESIEEEKYFAAFKPNSSLGVGMKTLSLHFFMNGALADTLSKIIFSPDEQ